MSKIKNVFISHVHEDDKKVQQLVHMLKGKGYQIRNSSIDSSNPNQAKDPDYIKTGILGPRIQWAGTMIVLISPGTHKSEWVNWEIEYAEKNDTRIIGVWAEGASESDLPENMENYAEAIVGWDADRIADAIDGKINSWHDTKGNPCPPREISRTRCQ